MDLGDAIQAVFVSASDFAKLLPDEAVFSTGLRRVVPACMVVQHIRFVFKLCNVRKPDPLTHPALKVGVSRSFPLVPRVVAGFLL